LRSLVNVIGGFFTLALGEVLWNLNSAVLLAYHRWTNEPNDRGLGSAKRSIAWSHQGHRTRIVASIIAAHLLQKINDL
jgi:hypothetical protein